MNRLTLWPVMALMCLFLFSTQCLAFQDADEEFLAAGQILKTFYVDPSQERLDELGGFLEKNSDDFSTPGNQFALISQLVMGIASKKYGLTIKGEGDVFDVARALAEGDTEDAFVEYVLEGDPSPDRNRQMVWWFTFFATGEEADLVKIAELVGDPYAGALGEDMELRRSIAEATSAMLKYGSEHKAIQVFLKKALTEKRWASKIPYFAQSLSYATARFEVGEGFDRSTPEGTLRQLFFAMMRGDNNLLRGVIEPVSNDDFEILSSNQRMDREVARSQLLNLKIRKLNVGDTFMIGKTEMVVNENQVNDRAMLAYLGPDESAPPFQVNQNMGIWWVNADAMIHMRRAAKKMRDR